MHNNNINNNNNFVADQLIRKQQINTQNIVIPYNLIKKMPSNKVHKCSKCGKTYKEKRDLVAHTLNCEYGITKSFYCPNCKNGYTFRSSLNKHKKKCKQSVEDIDCLNNQTNANYEDIKARKAIRDLTNYFSKNSPDNDVAQKAIKDLRNCFRRITNLTK